MTPESEVAERIMDLAAVADPSKAKALFMAAKYKAEAAATALAPETAKANTLDFSEMMGLAIIIIFGALIIGLLITVVASRGIEKTLEAIYVKLPQFLFRLFFTIIIVFIGLLMYICTLGFMNVYIHTDFFGSGRIAAWPKPLIKGIEDFVENFLPIIIDAFKKEGKFVGLILTEIGKRLLMLAMLITVGIYEVFNWLFIEPRRKMITDNTGTWGWE